MEQFPAAVRDAAVGLVLLFVAAVLAELMWWNLGSRSYPSALIDHAPLETHDLISLRAACGEPLWIKESSNDFALVRCGRFWPSRSVWLVPRSELAPMFSVYR